MNKVEAIQQILESPKTVTASAVITGATGASSALNWIPDDIGKLASLICIVVTMATFYLYRRKMLLEIRILEQKINARN